MRTGSPAAKTLAVLFGLALLAFLFCLWHLFGPPSWPLFVGYDAVVADKQGNIYVSGGSCVKKFNPDLSFVGTWGKCDEDNFSSPKLLTISPQGDFYGLAYKLNSNELFLRVQKLDDNGNVLSSWGVGGTENDSSGKPSQFAVTSDGNVYLLDSYARRIREFDNTGNFVASWQTGDASFKTKMAVFDKKDSSGNTYAINDSNIESKTPDGKVFASWYPHYNDASYKNFWVSDQGKVYALLGSSPRPAAYVFIYDRAGNLQAKLDSTMPTWTQLSYFLIFLVGFVMFILGFALLLVRMNEIVGHKRKLRANLFTYPR